MSDIVRNWEPLFTVTVFPIAMNVRRLPHALIIVALLVATKDAIAQSDMDSLRGETLRGTVLAAGSHLPISRARVAIEGTKLGAIASEEGQFRIANVHVGHYIVRASSGGYSPASQEIIVSSAHQAVLDFELKERVVKGDSITITGSSALEAINPDAVVSVTPFSIEDVKRYAAAFQDPARMADNFAGVFGHGTSNNYIIVRGGSPIELLWRLDGIDIPNPNHLGKNGSTGGLISAINSEMLGNSDFFTGAFPSEYGTKLSAVFDLHTRNGNSENLEGSAQLSFNGMELMGEGPIPYTEGSSFLLGYRHSTLSFLRSLGILDYTDLPNFDDAMGKLRMKLGEYDQITATGLWGIASINDNNTSGSEIGAGSGILVGGVDWQHIFSDKVIMHLLVNHAENRFDESLGFSGTEEITIGYTTAKIEANYTPNTDNSFEIGAAVQKANVQINQTREFGFNTTQKTNLFQAYINWNWHIIPQIVLNTGLYSQFIAYDTGSSYEPRASLSWSPSEEHSFAVAFGVHRQPEPIQFTQALHYVGGYAFRPSSDLLIKAEGYYKDYSNVPIHASTKDFYSFLNEGFAERIDYFDLVNNGVGRTYGAELTLMKHYNKGYYITATTSYVRQQFAGSDGIWHFGAFDNIYIINLLAGYDFSLGANSVLTLSEKFTIAGGSAYTPFDLEKSYEFGHEMFDTSRAFSARNPPYVRFDLNAEFHINWRSSTLTIYASILNLLNIKNPTSRYVHFGNAFPVVKEDYDLPIIPIIGIRFDF